MRWDRELGRDDFPFQVVRMHVLILAQDGSCWRGQKMELLLTSVKGGSAVEITCHEAGLCLFSYSIIPHSPDSTLKKTYMPTLG